MSLPALEILSALEEKEILDATDRRLIAWLRDHAGIADAEDAHAFTLTVAALCRACGEGSLCLPLEDAELGGILRELLSASGLSGDDGDPAAARFLAAAHAGRYDAVLGTPAAPRPLVRAHGNLYWHRFWFAEKTVAEDIAARLRADAPPLSAEILEPILRETLAEIPLRARDGAPLTLAAGQHEALVAALRAPVFVLSGGPGTGKTTWTAAWLRAVLRLPGVTPDRVRLCAPTGRAARRLEESLRGALAAVSGDTANAGEGEDRRHAADAAAREMPVTTLHALLGWRAFEGRFARGPEDFIDADWILLDEASMADVFLMAALIRSLRPDARLVLAGDPDQLPAVEAGSVLGEMLPEDPAEKEGRSEGAIPSVTLETSHRARGAVLPLAAATRAGDADAVMAALGGAITAGEAFAPGRPVARIAPSGRGGKGDGDADLKDLLREHAAAVFESPRAGGRSYGELLQRFRTRAREEEPAALGALWELAGRARVLAPLRRGPASAERANRLLRELLEPRWRLPGDARGAGFHGAPILITRNDARTGLSNGEIGIWLEASGGAAVCFPRPELPGGWLRLPVALLPAHEPGFASTVHKSQGSECDDVLILLPERGNRLLARETLYTAITRARNAVRIFGAEDAIREAVERKMTRYGGLRKMMNYELRITN